MRAQRFLSPKDTIGVLKDHVLEVSQSEWKTNTNDGRASKQSTMLKTDKLSNGNVRLHLTIPEICQVRSSSLNPRITFFGKYFV